MPLETKNTLWIRKWESRYSKTNTFRLGPSIYGINSLSNQKSGRALQTFGRLTVLRESYIEFHIIIPQNKTHSWFYKMLYKLVFLNTFWTTFRNRVKLAPVSGERMCTVLVNRLED